MECELTHVRQWVEWLGRDGWEYLADGHARWDARCQGGAWYYRGDRVAALAKLAEYKQEQEARARGYYSRPWV